MKTLRLLIILTISVIGYGGNAYIPPSRTIFEKLIANSGSGTYQLEFDVEFQNGGEPLILRETWIVDGDQSLRVRVSGVGAMAGRVQIDSLYAAGQKWTRKGGQNSAVGLPREFFERIFHLRQIDNVPPVMAALGLQLAPVLEKKPVPRKSDEFRYTPEPLVRFARTGGIVAWAYGESAPSDGARRPGGLWIEQDQFVVRRLRFPESAEVIASDHESYPRGLRFPRQRIVRWGGHEVSLRLLSATTKQGSNKELQPSSITESRPLENLDDLPAKQAILEFYQRFR